MYVRFIDVKNIYGILLRPPTLLTGLFTSYFRSTFILSSYLVIPKGKAADGEERECRLSRPSLLFSGGLQVCGEINI